MRGMDEKFLIEAQLFSTNSLRDSQRITKMKTKTPISLKDP